MEGQNFGMIHGERMKLADRELGANLRGLGRATRNVTPAMRYWSVACRTGHPDRCSGRRRAIHGERGWKSCENPAHQVTTEDVTKVHIDNLQA